MNTTTIPPSRSEILSAQQAFAEHLQVSDELGYVVADNVPYNTRLHHFRAHTSLGPFIGDAAHQWDHTNITLNEHDEASVYRFFKDCESETPFAIFVAYHEPGIEIDELLYHQFYLHEIDHRYIRTLLGVAYDKIREVCQSPRQRKHAM